MVAFPSLCSVPTKTHCLNSAFASFFMLIDPYRLKTSSLNRARTTPPGSIWRSNNLFLDSDPLDHSLLRLCQRSMAKIMLQPLSNLKRFLKLCDPLLEVVVKFQMAISVLETLFAGLKGNFLPVAFKLLFSLAYFRPYLPHVMFFYESLALVPRSPPSRME